MLAAKEQGTFSPEGVIPAHEMLGDILIEMERPEQALGEYETELKLGPNRFNSLYGAGRAAEMASNPGKAAAYYEQLLKVCVRGNSSRPELAHARGFLITVAKGK